jgi:hypothetical protein
MKTEHSAHQHSHEHEDQKLKATRRGLVAAGVLAVAAAGIGASLAVRHEHAQKHEARAEAFRSIDTLMFRPIKLTSEIQFYITPEQNTLENDGDRKNLAGMPVPKDKSWFETAEFTSTKHPGWIAITKPGENNEFKSQNDRIDGTYWVYMGDDYAVKGKGGQPNMNFNADGQVVLEGRVDPSIGATAEIKTDQLNVLNYLPDLD